MNCLFQSTKIRNRLLLLFVLFDNWPSEKIFSTHFCPRNIIAFTNHSVAARVTRVVEGSNDKGPKGVIRGIATSAANRTAIVPRGGEERKKKTEGDRPNADKARMRERREKERESKSKSESERERDRDGNRKSMHRPVAYDALSGILCTRAPARSTTKDDVFAAYRAGG